MIDLLPAVIPFPEMDNALISIGWFEIRYYSLAYIFGLIFGWLWCRHLIRPAFWPEKKGLAAPPLNKTQMDDLLFWIALGVILGGRIGYVLFYKPGYYLSHPAEIIEVWTGGMAFHGGLLGVILAVIWFARRNQLDLFRIADILACATPIGLLFGRIANFINGELYGRATNVPWAMIFPADRAQIPRHPSQLYEAALEGLLLLLLINALFLTTRLRFSPGRLAGLFFLGYGLARGFVEFFREPDGFMPNFPLDITMGQILCLPMIAFGLWLLFRTNDAARKASA